MNSAGGDDAVNIGNVSSGIRSINADVQIQNDPAFTNLQILNGPDTGNRTWEVGISGSFGFLTGMAPANIFWDNADINAIGLLCGSGVDTGSITRLSETLQINNTNGDNFDQITIGNPTNGVQSITQGRAGGLTIDNDPDFTHLTFDDTGDATARTITHDLVAGYNQITGLAPAVIRYDDADTRNVTIRTGSNSDTVNYLRAATVGGTTNITSVGGNDAVNIGNPTGGVQNIANQILYITNPPSFSALNINNGPDTIGRTVTIDTFNAADVVQTVTGLVSGTTIQWNTSDIISASAQPITFGSGLDTINILRNRTNLHVTTTGSGDVVAVGNNTNGCNDIGRNITLQNPPSFTTLIINDTGNTNGRAWTVASGGGFGQLFVNMFTQINYTLADTASPVTMNLGSGNDTVRVTGLDSRTLVLNGNGGDDTFEFGSLANVVDPVNVPVTVNGGAGTDVATFFNQGDATESGFSVVGNVVSQNDMANVTYNSEVESLNFFGGTGGAAFHVFTNTPSSTFLFLNPGNSVDQIFATNNAQVLTVRPSGGFDNITVNLLGSSGLVYFDSTIVLGSLTINANGRVVAPASGTAVSVRSLFVDPNGQLDLYDNALVWDYTGGTPFNTLRGYIQTGYAGGTWSGVGVASGVASGTPGTGIGYAESTDIFSAFPANFAGINVDSTALLARYTLLGDSTLNKSVDIADFALLGANFNVSPTNWYRGDYNYDLATGISDFALLVGNFNRSLPRLSPPQTSVAQSVFSPRTIDDDQELVV